MEKNNFPLVSLITPGWNGVSFVGRLLDSILNQTYPNMEYIYIDDGSTDGTKDVVLSYKEKFQKAGISFEYVYKENGGVSFPNCFMQVCGFSWFPLSWVHALSLPQTVSASPHEQGLWDSGSM